MVVCCHRQDVVKGKPSPTTYVTFESWGISRDRISLRYHLNFHEDDWTDPKVPTDTVQVPVDPEIMELAVTQECHQKYAVPCTDTTY